MDVVLGGRPAIPPRAPVGPPRDRKSVAVVLGRARSKVEAAASQEKAQARKISREGPCGTTRGKINTAP